MPYGKTLEMRYLKLTGGRRPVTEKDKEPRDRSLRGKARRKARKAANRG